MPYKSTGSAWEEFPQEIAQYQIKTADGPHSQKDDRRWATGRLEYRVPTAREATQVYRSPQPVRNHGCASFSWMRCSRPNSQTLTVETSTDDGRTWSPAGTLRGPHQGPWQIEPEVLTRSEHGRRTAVSGSYDYHVKVTKAAAERSCAAACCCTRIQLNPRTLPALVAGHNDLIYTAGPPIVRRAIAAIPFQTVYRTRATFRMAHRATGFRRQNGPAELIFIACTMRPAIRH